MSHLVAPLSNTIHNIRLIKNTFNTKKAKENEFMKLQLNGELTIEKEGLARGTVYDLKKGKDVQTKAGKTPTALVTFELENGRRIIQSILLYTSQYSLLTKLIKATLGETEGIIEASNMIGKRCVVEIKHNFTGTSLYANVVDILSEDEVAWEEDDEDLDEY